MQPNNDLKLMQGLSVKSLKHHVALQVKIEPTLCRTSPVKVNNICRAPGKNKTTLCCTEKLMIFDIAGRSYFLPQPLFVIMTAGIIFVGAYCGR